MILYGRIETIFAVRLLEFVRKFRQDMKNLAVTEFQRFMNLLFRNLRILKSFLNRIDKKIEVDHHDMGFLYSPSCVAAYKLIGSEEGKEAAIKAADQLITRYHPVGEFIQAWGPMDAPENYRRKYSVTRRNSSIYSFLPVYL